MDPKYLVKAIKAGVLAALFTPFIVSLDFYFPFVGPKGIYFMAVSEAVICLWAVLAWRWQEYRPSPKNPLVIALLVFAGISFVSAVFGANFSASFWSKFERMGGILMLLHLIGFALAAAAVIKGRDWLLFFLASSAIAAVIGYQAMFDLNTVSRGGGFLGNDSFLGVYLMFNAFFSLYAFISYGWREHYKMKLFAGVLSLVIIFCLVFEGTMFWKGLIWGPTYSHSGGVFYDIVENGARAAKISFFAGLALLAALRMAVHKNKVIRNATIAAAGLIMATVVFSAASVFQKSGPVYQFLADRMNDSAFSSRAAIWKIGWQGFLARPVLGWGPENFNFAFARNYNPCLGSHECGTDIWYDRAHNIIIDTLVETGIAGILSYVGIFAAAIFLLWRAYALGKADFAASGIFTAALAAYFLQNMTVFDMVTSYLMFFLCLAFAGSFYGSGGNKNKLPLPLGTKRVAVPALIFAGCFLFFVIKPMEAGAGVMEASMQKYGSGERLAAYSSVFEASPLGKYQIRIFFANQWLAAMQNKNIASRLNSEQAQNTYSLLSQELEKSCQEPPLDYQSCLELGRLYNGWSLIDKSKLSLAENVLKKTIEISPKNQQGYWDLAQNYLYQARFADAKDAARRAYELYPGNAQAKTVIDQINRIEAEAAAAAKDRPAVLK